MTKYIDLLRAHRQSSNPNASAPLLTPNREDVNLNLPDETCDDVIIETPFLSHEFKDLIDEENLNPSTKATHSKPSTDVSSHTEAEHQTHHFKNTPWLRQCIRHIQSVFERAEQNQACNFSALSQHIQHLLSQLQNDHEQQIMDSLELNISQQTQHIRERHSSLGGLIQKSILMMLYTIKTGQRLKLSTTDLHIHTFAAMLHHIGMAQIPKEIRNKKERLTKKELKEIHQAPRLGFEYLKTSNIDDNIILDACLFANERYDGSGATGLSGSNIAWSARLTGVLSMFEALIHYRPYRNRLLPRDAIREMVKNHKKSFDPDMLKALIESISLYPIGTYSQLNTGEIGLVTHIHPYRPLRPVVEIRMDRHGNPIPPRKIDLTTQPNLTVERCMYEETTLALSNKQHE